MTQFSQWWKTRRKTKLLERRLRRLESKGHARRLRAIWDLKSSRDARAVSPLAALLNDEDVAFLTDERLQQQRAAAIALASFQDARALEPLVALLKSSENWEREEIIKALVRLGDERAVEPLAALLGGRGRVSDAAAAALLYLGDTRGVKVLIEHLVREQKGYYKKSAYRKLKEILMSGPARITVEDLRTIANLQDKLVYIPRYHGSYDEAEGLFSVSYLKKLASEELARRRLEV